MNTIILFVFGAVIGSFLNVLGLRFKSGLSLSGRSHCSRCAKKLSWWELVPILSFILLRGRCSRCKSGISIQYPLIEIWTGLVFLTIFNLEFSIFNKIIILGIFCLYTTIAIYDFRHKIIPDEFVYPAIALALISNFELRISNLAAGAIIFLFFASVWYFSSGRAMGFGDAKLGASIGLLLGLSQGLSAIVLSFWIGAVVGITLMKFGRKKLTMKSELPFGPFMVLGAWLALILNLDIFHVAIWL